MLMDVWFNGYRMLRPRTELTHSLIYSVRSSVTRSDDCTSPGRRKRIQVLLSSPHWRRSYACWDNPVSSLYRGKLVPTHGGGTELTLCTPSNSPPCTSTLARFSLKDSQLRPSIWNRRLDQDQHRSQRSRRRYVVKPVAKSWIPQLTLHWPRSHFRNPTVQRYASDQSSHHDRIPCLRRDWGQVLLPWMQECSRRRPVVQQGVSEAPVHF
jgi:hypothetical protein